MGPWDPRGGEEDPRQVLFFSEWSVSSTARQVSLFHDALFSRHWATRGHLGVPCPSQGFLLVSWHRWLGRQVTQPWCPGQQSQDPPTWEAQPWWDGSPWRDRSPWRSPSESGSSSAPLTRFLCNPPGLSLGQETRKSHLFFLVSKSYALATGPSRLGRTEELTHRTRAVLAGHGCEAGSQDRAAAVSLGEFPALGFQQQSLCPWTHTCRPQAHGHGAWEAFLGGGPSYVQHVGEQGHLLSMTTLTVGTLPSWLCCLLGYDERGARFGAHQREGAPSITHTARTYL